MKHPVHGVKVCIEGTDYVCNEFKTLHKGRISSCLIPSFPVTDWRFTWDVNLLESDTHPLPIYKIEGYVGGIQTSGPIYIDRRKRNEIIGFSPDLSRVGDESVFKKGCNGLTAKYETQRPNPADQLIEVKIYKCHKKPPTGNLGLQYPPGLFPAEVLDAFNKQAQYLVIHYKFSYNFADKLCSSVNSSDLKHNRYQKAYPETLPSYSLGSQKTHPRLAQMETESAGITHRRSRPGYYMFLRRVTGFKGGRSPLSSRMADSNGSWVWAQRPAAEQTWGPHHAVAVNLYREFDGQSVNTVKVGPDPDLCWLGRLKDYYPVPAGWEMRYTTEGNPYYTNHLYQSTTWEHPLLGCLEYHKDTAWKAIEREQHLDQYSSNSAVSTPKIKARTNDNGQQPEDINKEGIVTQELGETRQDQRPPSNWDSLSVSHPYSDNPGQVNHNMLQRLRDKIDVLQIARAEVQDKHDVYLDGCEELSNWTKKYFHLWFPMYGTNTSPIHEKEVYLFNRSVLFGRIVKELGSLEDQLVIAEEEEARLIDQLDEQESINFRSIREEVDEEAGKKRKLGDLVRMADVAHQLLLEFPLPNDEAIDTQIDPDLYRDKVLKTEELPQGYQQTDNISATYDSGCYTSTSPNESHNYPPRGPQPAVEGNVTQVKPQDSGNKSSRGSEKSSLCQGKLIAAADMSGIRTNSFANGDINETGAASWLVGIGKNTTTAIVENSNLPPMEIDTETI